MAWNCAPTRLCSLASPPYLYFLMIAIFRAHCDAYTGEFYCKTYTQRVRELGRVIMRQQQEKAANDFEHRLEFF